MLCVGVALSTVLPIDISSVVSPVLPARLFVWLQLGVIQDILNTHERAMKEMEGQVGDLLREAAQLKTHLDIGRA